MGDELTVQLIEQLRAAMETASQIGDKRVLYLVRRALNGCLLRWDEPPGVPSNDVD